MPGTAGTAAQSGSAEATDRIGVIDWHQDADGIVTLTMDDPGQRANIMNGAFSDSLAPVLDRLYAEQDSIAGVILTSAKDTFFAGGDLALLRGVTDETAAEFFAAVQQLKAALRRLETYPHPVVAALNGTALGAGLEIALACHHRIALDRDRAEFGLPEVTLGLLPGSGGVTRTVRMLGIADALTKLLLKGQRLRPAEAVEAGIVDELASSPDELLAAARRWIAANPVPSQPWDRPGFRIPGGTPANPSFAAMLPAFPATLRKQLKGAPMPAPHHILAAAVEGSQVDLDTALRIESRYLTDLARGPVAKNMISAFWFDLNAVNSGASRPAGHPPRQASRVAVLGAGMMGAGIAYVAARNGLEVVLRDVSAEAAEKGKDYSRTLLDKAVARGRLSEAARDEVLARITPTDSVAAAAGCDLVIEAVYENASLKHQVLAEVEAVVAPDALLGSNTSTLPITMLAEGVRRRQDFLGLHFFSPVDRMPLLEVIRGEQTSDAALARALDFARQIKKTPIVVNDSRGFFTSRVIGTHLNEALAMLGEGVPPATIEQATTQAGYPVGALQLADELNMELFAKIRDEARSAVQAAAGTLEAHPGEAVVDRMLALGRPGRLRGAGFYDYDEAGQRLDLWPGLRAEFGAAERTPAGQDLTELQERMLFAEALESVRCLQEGVLTTVADANIGSLLGIGFPPWTGGVLRYVNGYRGATGARLPGFIARADQLAERYGRRFRPPELLAAKAAAGETF